MALKTDIESTSGLGTAWMPGLRALEQADRERLKVTSPRSLCGSAAIDSALRAIYPQDNRWDYVVCKVHGADEEAHFIEVHPATTTSHVREVGAKAEWLLTWLKSTPLADKPRQLHWIATGTVSFTAQSPALKALAKKGVSLRGRTLNL